MKGLKFIKCDLIKLFFHIVLTMYLFFEFKDSSTEKKQELVVMQGGIEMVK